MISVKRRLLVILASAAMTAAVVPGVALASTDLHVCTWHTQQVGDAVGTISAAPGAVLGPNNGAQPGGDKGPFTISFGTTDASALSTNSGSGSCA